MWLPFLSLFRPSRKAIQQVDLRVELTGETRVRTDKGKINGNDKKYRVGWGSNLRRSVD